MKLLALLSAVLVLGATAQIPPSVSPPPVDPANESYFEEIKAFKKTRKLAEAIAASRDLVAKLDAQEPEDSRLLADAYHILLMVVNESGERSTEANLELAVAAVDRRARAYGAAHYQTANTMSLYADMLMGARQREESLAKYREVLALRQSALGPGHRDVAETLTNLVFPLINLGKFDEAIRSLEEAVSIFEKTDGPDSYGVGASSMNLGNMYQESGDYEAARAAHERTLGIWEALYGSDGVAVANICTSLGNSLLGLGEYEESARVHKRALDIRQAKLKSGHPYIGQALLNYGNALRRMGEYSRAFDVQTRGLEIYEESLSPDHSWLATGYGAVGMAADAMGDDTAAIEHYEKARAKFEESLGPNHARVANMLTVLAATRKRLGDYELAESQLRRAVKIHEDTAGRDSPVTALALGNLANLLSDRKRFEEAGELYEEVLRTERASIGEAHAQYGQSLANYANFQRRSGAPEKALASHEKALGIRIKALGPDHPDLAGQYFNLAAAHIALEDPAAALDAALVAERIRVAHVRLTATSVPERIALEYSSSGTSGLGLALGLDGDALEIEGRRGLLDQVIQSRAVVLDEMVRRRRSLTDLEGPEVEGLFEELVLAGRKLANVRMSGPGQSETYSDEVATALDAFESAEQALGEVSAEYRKTLEERKIRLPEIENALETGDALVSFSSVAFGLDPESSAIKPDELPRFYTAFVLRAGTSEPKLVRLDAVEAIDAAIVQWRAELTRNDEIAYRAAARRVREKLWDPVARHLERRGRVFVVPDGMINFVNFAALPVGSKKYLVEKGLEIHYLSAERDLVTSEEEHSISSGFLAVGGADFDATSSFSALTPPSDDVPEIELVAQREASPETSGRRSACGAFESARWRPLPHSLAEVDEIGSIWSQSDESGTVRVLTGPAATEAAFKTGSSDVKILHLATHGFFLGDSCPSALGADRGLVVKNPQSSDTDQEPAADGENPLLFSGLVLAGANHRESALEDEEDGVLTAEEIGTLNLAGTAWAVLSACDTGLGEVENGEGVLGLRRAFQVAGVRTVIMSLWPVDDEVARLWMEALYRARLGEGKTTTEAIRQSNLELLQGRRKQKLGTHPAHWAAFVATGDWR